MEASIYCWREKPTGLKQLEVVNNVPMQRRATIALRKDGKYIIILLEGK
jgi:hypothetical protein